MIGETYTVPADVPLDQTKAPIDYEGRKPQRVLETPKGAKIRPRDTRPLTAQEEIDVNRLAGMNAEQEWPEAWPVCCPGCCGEGVVENYSCLQCGGTGNLEVVPASSLTGLVEALAQEFHLRAIEADRKYGETTSEDMKQRYIGEEHGFDHAADSCRAALAKHQPREDRNG